MTRPAQAARFSRTCPKPVREGAKMRTGALRDALGALKTPCKFKNRSEFEGLQTGLAQFPLGHHAMDKGAKYARIRPFIRLAARVCQLSPACCFAHASHEPEALGTRSQPGREVKPFGAGCKAAYRAYRRRALQPAWGLARICQAPTARVRSLPFASRSQTPSRF